MLITRYFLSSSSTPQMRPLNFDTQAISREYLSPAAILIFFLAIFLLPQKKLHAAPIRPRRPAPTVVLCPNYSETGNYAACAPAPTLAFGNQGSGTASMAIPISVNNCSTPMIAACTGSGSVTLAGSPFTISGANSEDFTVSNGTCTPGQVLAAGQYCEPTVTFTPSASTGKNETATLTVREDGGATDRQTMTLTGTSTTVTTLSSSSCPTNLTTGNYELTADISCPNTAFTYSGPGLVDVNLNGHTVTYGTASQATQIGAFLSGASLPQLFVHNGTLSHGAGTNSFYSSSHETHRSSVLGFIAGTVGQGDGNQFFNLTINYNYQYANAIELAGGNALIHDVTINSTGIGNCDNPNCRSLFDSGAIYQENGANLPSAGMQIYNVSQFGGPQGGIAVDDPGAIIAYNYLNPGNSVGTNTNEFAIIAYSPAANIHNNLILTPITPNSDSRGILISDAEGLGIGGKNVYNNYIGAFEQQNNTEYNKPPQSTYTTLSGCEIGGTYTTQFDDNPVGTNIAHNNMNVVTVDKCGSSALRVTSSLVTTNISENNKYAAVREPTAPTCVPIEWADPNTGCAYGFAVEGPTGFTSSSDTFTADSGDVFISADGGTGITINSPIFNEGKNPSGFHTFVAQNGPAEYGEPGLIHIVDATFNKGTSPTDAYIFSQVNDPDNVGPASFYIDWTQYLMVTEARVKASGRVAAGATVTFTDRLSNTYTCTTDSNGRCSVVVTEYRDNNDGPPTPAVEDRNPFSLSISESGCTPYTQTGLRISAKTVRGITLRGC